MYEVEWLRPAIEQLAAIWDHAHLELRKDITRTAHQLDDQLQADPFGVGESRRGNQRILLGAPLGIYYQVDRAAQKVRVGRVWQFRVGPPA